MKIQYYLFHDHSGIPLCMILLLTCITTGAVNVQAQPSGGPYGPIQQCWEIPADAGRIYYAAPDGLADAEGGSVEQPTTVEAAIARARTGDVIVLRGGIYRTGGLVFNQGITLQPYQDEQPIFKGTFVAAEWQKTGDGLWTASWPHLFPSKPAGWWRRLREGRVTPLHKFNNDMVFIDGRFLQSAGWEGEVDENSFFIDYENNRVCIGTDPAGRLVEITAFNSAIVRTTGKVHGRKSDGKGPVIRGITFTQYAYRALEIEGKDPEGLSAEADHGKDVIGTTLEHCTISYCSRVAAYLRGDHLTLRHCRVSDTSTEGIYIIGSSDVLLEKNIFMRNNIERITGYYPAAVKIFNQCYRVTCRDNLVIDHPYSNGIWYDVGNVDGVFVDNWVQDVGLNTHNFNGRSIWPGENGFFFEISKGAVCAGNVFVNCDHGICVLNSSNVRMVQNTLVNSMACIARTERSAANDHFGWHPSTGPDVDERTGHVFINNLLTCDETCQNPLLTVWQPEPLCATVRSPQIGKMAGNVFVRKSDDVPESLLFWSPVNDEECRMWFDSLEAFLKIKPEYSDAGRDMKGYRGPLFKSNELGDYRLLGAFPGVSAAVSVPDHDLPAGMPAHDGNYAGAYPPLE
ncbi:right-handed parallel beta-helix repeat-containing protein [bacterium]|nr:right-handed parallel beta-helix repeat-containing protein [bacterium]